MPASCCTGTSCFRSTRRNGRTLDPEAVIIGAGVAGLYQLYRLRELGMRVQVFEAGSDVGGTWYWNRYPGARFDSESWSYGYSFSEELLQEWEWPEHFSAQPDTLRYLEARGRQVRPAPRHAASAAASSPRISTTADDRWTITLESGEQDRAPLLITALGPLSAYTLPNIPGRDSFQRRGLPHRALAAQPASALAGKRVGIIGTGATAIQCIQTIAREVGSLTVFQRTPNWAAPLHNRRITAGRADEDQGALSARSSSAAARPAPASSTRPIRARRSRFRPRSARRSGRSSMPSPASASGSAISPTC